MVEVLRYLAESEHKSRAEQGSGADCQKRPLVPRFRFRQQLTAGVRLTFRQGWERKRQVLSQ